MKDFSFPLIFTGESKNMNSSRNAGLGCWDKYRERVIKLGVCKNIQRGIVIRIQTIRERIGKCLQS